jgi:hypothetical protein
MTKITVAPITIGQYCVCTQFRIASGKSKLKAALKKSATQDLKASLIKHFKTENAKDQKEIAGLAVEASWGEDRRDKSKPSIKFSISPRDKVDYAIVSKVLPFIQESIDIVKQYDISDIRFTSCVEFGFNLNQFKPVAQFPIPADLPLNVELAKKLGKARLTTFGMIFEESPISLDKAEIEYNEESNEIAVTLGLTVKPTSLDNILSFSYNNLIQIAKLFVVEKNE